MLINGRNLTNLVFKYVQRYLKEHPDTNDSLTMMFYRTAQGIPIQIYTFSKDKEWTKYEALKIILSSVMVTRFQFPAQ